jgi:hypothetical protein
MKIRTTLIVIAAVLTVSCVRHRSTPQGDRSNGANQSTSSTNSLKPKLGYVPDEATAIAIAKAVWSPVFGKDAVEAQHPIRANLQNGVWVVQGRNPVPYPESTFVALISQDDGRIVEVSWYND